MFLDYFERVGEGIEFILAFGSVMGLLGLIFGLVGFIFGGPRVRLKFLGIIIFSFVILGFCGGPGRGIKYFRIH